MFARGRRTSGSYANIAVLANDLAFSRFGLSVSKRVGTAVTRNQVKRRMRHVLADMNIADGWDVVVTAKPQSSGVSYAMLGETIQRLFKRLGIPVAATDIYCAGAIE